MTWNYRVVRHSHETDPFYEIHEVFYDENGKAAGLTEDGIALGAESAVGIALSLPLYLKALTAPILDYDTREDVEPPVGVQAIQTR